MKILSFITCCLLVFSAHGATTTANATTTSGSLNTIDTDTSTLKTSADMSVGGVNDSAVVTIQPAVHFELDDLGLDAKLTTPMGVESQYTYMGRPELKLSHAFIVSDESLVTPSFAMRVPACRSAALTKSDRNSICGWRLEPGAYMDTSIGRSRLRFVASGSIAYDGTYSGNANMNGKMVQYSISAPWTSRFFVGTKYAASPYSITGGFRFINSLTEAKTELNDPTAASQVGNDPSLEYAAAELNGDYKLDNDLTLLGGMTWSVLRANSQNMHVARVTAFDNLNEVADFAIHLGVSKEF